MGLSKQGSTLLGAISNYKYNYLDYNYNLILTKSHDPFGAVP